MSKPCSGPWMTSPSEVRRNRVKKRQLNFVLISILLRFGSGLEFGSVDLDLDPGKMTHKRREKIEEKFHVLNCLKFLKNFI